MVKLFNKTNVRDKIIKKEDQDFVSQVYSDYEASKEMKPTDTWEKYDEYVEDDQWDAADAKDEWKPKPQVNICFKVLQTIHANMTSGQTAINVTAKKPVFGEKSKKVNDVFDYYWDALDMDIKLSELEWIRPKLGGVVLKVPWNPALNDGEGDVDAEVVHPLNFFPDPNITNPLKIQQADFIDFVQPRTIRYVIRHYSKERDPLCKYTEDELRQILVPESDFADTEKYGDAVSTTSSSVPETLVGTDKSYRSLNSRDRVKLHEYYYKDDKNKLQVAWVAGQTLLKHTVDDKEMAEEGFYRHGRYPAVIIPYIQKDKRLWGRSELQSLIGKSSKRDGIQDIVNMIIQDYLVNLKLMGQGQLAYQHGMIKDPHKLTGEAGLKIPTKGNPRQVIWRMEGKPMQGAMETVEAFLTHADRITNMWDVTQGRSTPNTKTASGTFALLEQAMRPQNDKLKTLNLGLREMAELWLEHLGEFATTDREYVKQTAEGQEVFTFNPSEELFEPADEDGESRRIYFNIKIDVGATLAMTRAYMLEFGMQLAQMGFMDLRGLYAMLPEFPGKSETLERMVEQQELMKQQQMGQMQQPPPEGEEGEEAIEPPTEEEIAFMQGLPPEIAEGLQKLPPDQLAHAVKGLMSMSPDELKNYYMQMVRDNQQMQ